MRAPGAPFPRRFPRGGGGGGSTSRPRWACGRAVRGSLTSSARGGHVARGVSGGGGQRAIHPAVLGGLAAGRAGFHVVLRVEVGSRRVRGTHRIDDGQLLLVEQRLERC